MTTFLNRLSQSAATRVEVDSAFAGTPVFHDGLAYASADVLVVNYAGTAAFYQAGIGFTAAGEMLVVDASAGLPSDTFHQSGLPISMAQKRLCVDPTGAVVYWHQGVPFTAVRAVAVTGAVAVTFDSVVITTGDGGEQVSPSLGMLRFGTSGSGGGYSSDQTTFLAAHPGLTLQDFSGITAPNTNTTTIPSFSGFVWTSDGTRYAFGVGSSSAPFDFIWALNATVGLRGFILTFSPAINAVGFNLAQNFGSNPDTVEFYSGATLLDTEAVSANIYSVFDTFVGYAT